jgi:hypothetical protein
MAVGGVFVAGVGYVYHATRLDVYPVTTPIVGFVVVIAGLVVAGFGFRRALKPMALIIDHEGIVPNDRFPAQRVLWPELRGAHFAFAELPSNNTYFRSRPKLPVVALELVDPVGFYRRWDANGPPRLGYDTGMRPDHFPIYYQGLKIDGGCLMAAIQEGIARHGRPAPDAEPQTIYPLFFN